MEFERAIGAFRVQPDWYEEYWLRPNKAAAPSTERRWRWKFVFLFHLVCSHGVNVGRVERNPGMLDAGTEAFERLIALHNIG